MLKLSAKAKIFLCEMCGHFLTLANSNINEPHFKHSKPNRKFFQHKIYLTLSEVIINHSAASAGLFVPNSPRNARTNIFLFSASICCKFFSAISLTRFSFVMNLSKNRAISFCSASGGKFISAAKIIFAETRGKFIPFEFATAYSINFGKLKK